MCRVISANPWQISSLTSYESLGSIPTFSLLSFHSVACLLKIPFLFISSYFIFVFCLFFIFFKSIETGRAFQNLLSTVEIHMGEYESDSFIDVMRNSRLGLFTFQGLCSQSTWGTREE